MDTIRLTTEFDLNTIFEIINDAAQAYGSYPLIAGMNRI